jgi:hypothetical protein
MMQSPVLKLVGNDTKVLMDQRGKKEIGYQKKVFLLKKIAKEMLGDDIEVDYTPLSDADFQATIPTENNSPAAQDETGAVGKTNITEKKELEHDSGDTHDGVNTPDGDLPVGFSHRDVQTPLAPVDQNLGRTIKKRKFIDNDDLDDGDEIYKSDSNAVETKQSDSSRKSIKLSNELQTGRSKLKLLNGGKLNRFGANTIRRVNLRQSPTNKSNGDPSVNTHPDFLSPRVNSDQLRPLDSQINRYVVNTSSMNDRQNYLGMDLGSDHGRSIDSHPDIKIYTHPKDDFVLTLHKLPVFDNIIDFELFVQQRARRHEYTDLISHMNSAAIAFCNQCIFAAWDRLLLPSYRTHEEKLSILKEFYANHDRFFTFMKQETDPNTYLRGSQVSVAENISHSTITAYRDQPDYMAILYREIFSITGFEKKFNDPSQDKCWEAEISALKLKLLGLSEKQKPAYHVAVLLLRRMEVTLGKNPKNISEWFTELQKALEEDNKLRIGVLSRQKELQAYSKRSNMSVTISNNTTSTFHPGTKNANALSTNEKKKTKPNKDKGTLIRCYMCGKVHPDGCRSFRHKDRNQNSNIPWAESEKGKAWKALGYDVLPDNYTLENAPSRISSGSSDHSHGSHGHDKKEKKPKGELLDELVNHHLLTFASRETIQGEIRLNEVQTDTRDGRIEILLDDGATMGNYVSKLIIEKFKSHIQIIDSSSQVIGTGFNGLAGKSLGKARLYVTFYDEIADARHAYIPIEANIIDTPFDLIIGKYTNLEHDLSKKLHFQFSQSRLMDSLETAAFRNRRDIAMQQSTGSRWGSLATFGPNGRVTVPLSKNVKSKSEFFKEIDSFDDDNDPEVYPPFDEFEYSTGLAIRPEELMPKEIFGSDTLQLALKALCSEFIDIFSREVDSQPAEVPKMQLDVDDEIWKSYKNRGAPRTQTPQAQAEIKRQIDILIKNKIIQKSNAVYYSQIVLAPKPNGNWRMCIDYKRLNEASDHNGWPLPNIKQLFQRIGSAKPKYFAVMDMTSGYHQIAMNPNSIIYTAFICFMGVFEWLRVPFGLKGAPGFFQQQLAAVVLAGIMHIFCELYIDDCIVYAQTESDYISRLREVFLRFRNYNIKLNPDKCKFGLEEVEYLGHILNSEGIRFSPDRLAKILTIARPRIAKDMKIYLGTVNYLRDHIENLSIIMAPLQAMITPYDKHSKKELVWTPELINAYEFLVMKVKECPTIFFMDQISPVFLHTDACDVGIGAYLFQVKENKEYPISFLSKALSGSQLNWSTYDKEAYAIYYAIFKLQYLIRDIKFTVRTDHRNLTYIGEGGTQKVARWREFLLPFNFDVEHIEGVKNIVADGLSRLCVFDEQIDEADFEDNEVFNKFDHSSILPAYFARACSQFLLAMSEEEISNPSFIIPEKAKHQISLVHNSNQGHFGVETTLSKLKNMGYKCKKLRDYVRVYIKRCPYCQLTNQRSYKTVIQPFTTSTYEPMQRLNIDTIGPLDVSTHGFQYILVVIDTFSRYVTLWPTRSTTATEAADVLVQHIGMFGNPKEILTDGGSQFNNQTMEELVAYLNAQLLITIAYSKEENAIVERSNKEVMRHLRAFIFDQRIIADWVKYLPLVQRIINNKCHDSTKVTPASIITPGIDLDNSILPSKKNSTGEVTITDYVKTLVDQQNTAIEIAKKHLLRHEKSHLVEPDLPLTVFPIGSHVILEYPKTAMGKRPPSKLRTHLQGPYKVSNIIGNEYFLEDLVDHRIKENVHVSRLRPYLEGNDTVETARQVANHGIQMWDVEKVLSHSGSLKYQMRTKLKFIIKWVDSEKPDELTWSELVGNRALHLYLIKLGKSNLIPKNYRHNYPEIDDSTTFTSE